MASPSRTDANSPKNPFSVYMQIVFDGQYGLSDGGAPRHNLKSGAADTGRSGRGAGPQDRRRQALQGRGAVLAYSADGAPSPEEGGAEALHDAVLDVDANWNLRSGNANCGVATLL